MPESTPSPAPHQPYVPDDVTLPEFTWSAVLVGAILGIIFGASSLYLVLKVGMTVSASIPVAVLSITLFRGFSRVFGVRRASILENNIVQTTGSAGESIAFGVGVTMPAVMLLGFEMDVARVMIVSVLGGLLGILMMIPLRRAFIVKQHGKLIYPEGTACADVLIIGETGGATAKTVFAGFGIAFVYQFLMLGVRLWKDVVSHPLSWLKGATPALETNPTLLGVGYIIGTKTSCIMVAGGALSWMVICPLIVYFGKSWPSVFQPGKIPICDMDADQLRQAYVLYIGAGAVAAGGIISMFRAMPMIVASITAGLRDLRKKEVAGGQWPVAGNEGSEVRDQGPGKVASNERSEVGGQGPDAANHKSEIINHKSLAPSPQPLVPSSPRTDRDLSMRIVLFGSLAMVAAIWVFLGVDPQAGGSWSPAAIFNWVNLAAAVLIVLFGFLFVTVSSRLTGEIGSSSNPISGMTIATLLLTCLIFLALGWTSAQYRLVVISIAAVVCIASSNGGTTSQDLKTGFLVGATPKWQQLSILVGSLSSALVIGVILLAMNSLGTVYSQKNLPQPKLPLDMAKLKATALQESAPKDAKSYYVWHAIEGNLEGVTPGKYLVDDQGTIRWLVDPGINGKLSRRDDGVEVRKYPQPQAQLFALITHGILNQKLPWTLVLIGVAVAMIVELCGISSLAFAVGMYLPLSSSTPIFVGGMARWVVERFGRGKAERPASELESEMSPGMLFSTGYIAGGSIAGVIISFLMFSDTIPDLLAVGRDFPYQTTAALATFALLTVLLVLVGWGRLLRSEGEKS